VRQAGVGYLMPVCVQLRIGLHNVGAEVTGTSERHHAGQCQVTFCIGGSDGQVEAGLKQKVQRQKDDQERNARGLN
jgi:hypothetical protein